MTERRTGRDADTGRRRRQSDADRFELLRDQILLAIGGTIVVGIGLAAIFVKIKNPELALAALTLGGTLLGVPSFLRIDSARRRRRK